MAVRGEGNRLWHSPQRKEKPENTTLGSSSALRTGVVSVTQAGVIVAIGTGLVTPLGPSSNPAARANRIRGTTTIHILSGADPGIVAMESPTFSEEQFPGGRPITAQGHDRAEASRFP